MSRGYDDIINLPCPTSKKHERMSRRARAAQFAPFAALVGYDDAIKETARITDKKYEPSDEQLRLLNDRFTELERRLLEKIYVSVTYFLPDRHKQGGRYVTERGRLTDIDGTHRIITLDGKFKILMDDIYAIDSDIFEYKMTELG